MERRELLIEWSPGGKLEFDVKNETDVVLLAKLLRELGLEPPKFTIASNDVVVEYDEKFMNYLLRDRGVDNRGNCINTKKIEEYTKHRRDNEEYIWSKYLN